MRGREGSNGSWRPYLQGQQFKYYDDLSGFARGSDTRKFTWDGFATTESETFYKRQPQDYPLLTRGVTSVINARPFDDYTVEGAYNYHVAGTDENNYLVFQDNSLIEFIFYPDEYIGEPS